MMSDLRNLWRRRQEVGAALDSGSLADDDPAWEQLPDLDEAIRVARQGAVIVGLHPTGNTSSPPWCDELPEPYRNVFMTVPFEEVTGWVIDPLRAARISEYSLWWMDVPEFLRTPHELYVRLGGSLASDAPDYQDLEPQLTKIFKEYGTSQGIILRHQRLLWQAYLP